MLTRMTYPDGSVHGFAYDPVHARLTSISEGAASKPITPFVSGLDYNKSGQVTEMRYGNRTVQNWKFDNRKRINLIDVTGPAGTVEDISYTLSPAGNVLTINNNEYTYDGFNRVAGAKTQLPGSVDPEKLVAKSFGSFRDASIVPTSGVLYDPDADLNSDDRVNGEDDILASYVSKAGKYDIESFTYDANGNRTVLVQNGDEYTYTYGKRNQLSTVHVRKAGENNRSLFAEYTYDENGNTMSRTIHASDGTTTTFKYDTLNRLVTTTSNGKTTSYAYDNAGNRLYKMDESGTTFYLRHGQITVAMDVTVYAPDSTEGATHLGMISRYVLSGDLVAGRITKKNPKSGAAVTEKSYYHLDHQNSSKAVTGETGEVVVQYVYRAFGEQLRRFWEGNPNKTVGNEMDDARYTYGGKELDDDTNLYYFNARYYDATTGRFINVDPVQDGSNWYVYCNNNPMNYIDPDGRVTITFGGGWGWAALISIGVNNGLLTVKITAGAGGGLYGAVDLSETEEDIGSKTGIGYDIKLSAASEETPSLDWSASGDVSVSNDKKVVANNDAEVTLSLGEQGKTLKSDGTVINSEPSGVSAGIIIVGGGTFKITIPIPEE